MPRPVAQLLIPAFFAGLVLAIAAVPLWIALTGSPPGARGSGSTRGPQPPPVLGELPDFSLVDQTGRTVTRDDLAGAPWIVDFIFTRCGGTCPRMTRAMAELGDSLAPDDPSDRRVRRVSITVDPEYDTPERLAEYAVAMGVEDPDWLFLTGAEEEILELARDGFELGVEPEGGTALEPIVHSNRFVLVDAAGRVRGYYDGLDPEGRARLLVELEALGVTGAAEPAEAG